MSMTNEQIQELKAAADKSADNFKPTMVVDTKLILSLLAERDVDKALIAEQAKRIAEVEQKADIYDMLRTDYELDGSLVEFVDWQAKRIAELEARTVTVKLPPSAPENLASVLDGYKKWLCATTFRDTWNACLAEVKRLNDDNFNHESPTLKVKLPEPLMPAQHNSGELFMTPDDVQQGGYLNRDDVLRVLRKACAAAGITLVVGE